VVHAAAQLSGGAVAAVVICLLVAACFAAVFVKYCFFTKALTDEEWAAMLEENDRAAAAAAEDAPAEDAGRESQVVRFGRNTVGNLFNRFSTARGSSAAAAPPKTRVSMAGGGEAVPTGRGSDVFMLMNPHSRAAPTHRWNTLFSFLGGQSDTLRAGGGDSDSDDGLDKDGGGLPVPRDPQSSVQDALTEL
jgi:hypothetical protein